jgi:cysteine desulfurase/selenocysteine lyase
VGDIPPFDIGTLLDQQGVAVRTGHHCAEPLIDTLGIPGTVRVSFGLYNDKNDIDLFIQALQKAQMMLS